MKEVDFEATNPREDILREIRESEREIAILRVAIEEGDIVRDGLGTKFWEIQKRTLSYLKQSYVEEACAAAQTPGQSPNFFLGRIACVDHVLGILEVNFVQGKERAELRRTSLQDRIKELRAILDKKSTAGYTGGTGEF